MTPISLLCCAALVAQAGDQRDTVTLTRGSAVEGRVLRVEADAVRVQVGSRVRTIPRDRIQSIDSVAQHHRQLLTALRRTDQASAAQLLELVEQCDTGRLEHEARLLCYRILLLDPDHPEANERLGHRDTGNGWRLPVAGRWLPLAVVEERRMRWNDAWQLRSEHFEVRCDRGLATTIRVLFELEYFYAGFYELWQRELELDELLTPATCYVYGDREQFPSASNNVGAWFSQSENVLYTWMQGDGRPFALFHEATHAVLYNLAGGSRSGRGRLPPWLDEALAEHMETVIVPVRPGIATLRPDRVHRGHLALVAESRDPYSLQRVLNFNSSDYGASSKQRLKYAQSYALFHHMLTGAGGTYRDRFTQYLRDALAGRGQASTFKRIFARELTKIERALVGDGRR